MKEFIYPYNRTYMYRNVFEIMSEATKLINKQSRKDKCKFINGFLKDSQFSGLFISSSYTRKKMDKQLKLYLTSLVIRGYIKLVRNIKKDFG